MPERIAVETLSLNEISELFQNSIEIAFPKSKADIENELERLRKLSINHFRWIQTYEVFKNARLNFYFEKIPTQDSPIVSVGMTHRTTNGMILVAVDISNGGILQNEFVPNFNWNKWVKIFTGHFCERFAERILNLEVATFKAGSEGIMFSDMLGPVRVTDVKAKGIDEIEFQFKEGQAYGYRDSNNKIIYFRTVYSNEMLKKDRLKFRKEWELPLEELYEIFKWK